MHILTYLRLSCQNGMSDTVSDELLLIKKNLRFLV